MSKSESNQYEQNSSIKVQVKVNYTYVSMSLYTLYDGTSYYDIHDVNI